MLDLAKLAQLYKYDRHWSKIELFLSHYNAFTTLNVAATGLATEMGTLGGSPALVCSLPGEPVD